MSLSSERFKEIWAKRGIQCSLKDVIEPEEEAEVNEHWRDMHRDTNWMDAFHSLWRKTDPDGHATQFSRTFYATAETMRADDDDDEAGCVTGRVPVGRSR